MNIPWENYVSRGDTHSYQNHRKRLVFGYRAKELLRER